MGAGEHKDKKVEKMGFAVITISDTRTKENDTSGQIIISSIEQSGCDVVDYRIIKDDINAIRDSFRELTMASSIDVLIFAGGTGISPRDRTPESISPMLEKELPGFGELFRQLSYEEIGTASLLSRAMAGVHGRKAIFCMPGSRGAVKLAMEKIILEEVGHILWEMRR